MEQQSLPFRCFKKYKDRFIYLIRKPLENSKLEESELFVNDNFIINKVYSLGLFVGYTFFFFNKDVLYSRDFLNFTCPFYTISEEDSCSILLKTKDFLVLTNKFNSNFLIIGNAKNDESDF